MVQQMKMKTSATEGKDETWEKEISPLPKFCPTSGFVTTKIDPFLWVHEDITVACYSMKGLPQIPKALHYLIYFHKICMNEIGELFPLSCTFQMLTSTNSEHNGKFHRNFMAQYSMLQ